MIKSICLTLLIVGAIDVCGAPGPNQVATHETTQTSASNGLKQVLSWLLADTETIAVARGPFVLAGRSGQDETQDHAVSDQELRRYFEDLPLALFHFNDGLLSARLKSKQIVLGVEGSRHFRAPADLGETPFEGAAIAVFADELGDDVSSFIRETRKVALLVEHIRGQHVPVFQEKLENDTWTTLVAFPNKHVVLVA